MKRVTKECQASLNAIICGVILRENYFNVGRQGAGGPPGRYDPNLDEISLGPIGPQGEIGPQVM